MQKLRDRGGTRTENRLAINKLKLKMRMFLTVQRCAESIKVTVGAASVWVALLQ